MTDNWRVMADRFARSSSPRTIARARSQAWAASDSWRASMARMASISATANGGVIGFWSLLGDFHEQR